MKKTNESTMNPLFKMALQKGILIAVIIHVKRGEIEDFDEFGQTPLMLSAIYGHLDIFEYLLRSGANFNAKNNLGLSLIDLAKSNKHENLLDSWRAISMKNNNEKNCGINEQEINHENYGWEAEVTEIPEDDVSCRIQALNIQRRISMHEGVNTGERISQKSNLLQKTQQRPINLYEEEFNASVIKFKNDDKFNIKNEKHPKFIGSIQVRDGEDDRIEAKEKSCEFATEISIEKIGAVFNVFKNSEKIATAYSEDQLEKILKFHKAWKLNDPELNTPAITTQEIDTELALNQVSFRVEEREDKYLVFNNNTQVAAVYTKEQAENIIKFHNEWKTKSN